MIEEQNYDVIIIGGSYAGLSAAMALGRSLRKTLVIDAGNPCNKPTLHSHNFLTQDGKTPAEITKVAKEQVKAYDTVEFYNGTATKASKTESGFEVNTESTKTFRAKKLIIATGIKDTMPEIPGMAACWGISLIHCPYCHGYEFRKKATAIFAEADRAFHVASLVNNLTNNLTILTNGKAKFTKEQTTTLQKHNVKIAEKELAEVVHENGYVKHVVFKDGSTQNFDAIYAGLPFIQHSDIPVQLGCELNEMGYVKTDNMHKTTVQGVYACGDNSNPMRSVANAVAGGNFTGAIVNKELTDETF